MRDEKFSSYFDSDIAKEEVELVDDHDRDRQRAKRAVPSYMIREELLKGWSAHVGPFPAVH